MIFQSLPSISNNLRNSKKFRPIAPQAATRIQQILSSRLPGRNRTATHVATGGGGVRGRKSITAPAPCLQLEDPYLKRQAVYSSCGARGLVCSRSGGSCGASEPGQPRRQVRGGAARWAAVQRVGRAVAQRGVAGVAVAPPPPAAQPGGTPSVTWRPHGSPREARGPRDPRQPPGREGQDAGVGILRGSGPGRRRSLPAALLRGRGSPAQPVGQSGVLLVLRVPGVLEPPRASLPL